VRPQAIGADMGAGRTRANRHLGAAAVAVAGPNPRARAIVVGGLFVFAIVVLFVGEALYSPTLDAADDPGAAHTQRTRVVLGILIEFMAVPAVIMIAATLFPILRRHAESLALAYVAVRILEGAILTVSYVAQLSRLHLSQSYLEGGQRDAVAEPLVDLLRSVDDWAGTTGLLYLVTFCLGSLVLFTVLYRARLVPRPIAGWGLLAAVVLLVGTILANLDLAGPLAGAGLQLAFAAPIAIAELLLAGWLILRGFEASAIAPQ
jgi:Domain of unknown function (DUF4386)